MSDITTPIIVRIEDGFLASGHLCLVQPHTQRLECRLLGDFDCLTNALQQRLDITAIGEEIRIEQRMMKWIPTLQLHVAFAAWMQ